MTPFWIAAGLLTLAVLAVLCWPLLRRHGNLLIWKGPGFAGEERETALKACPKLGFRHVADRAVVARCRMLLRQRRNGDALTFAQGVARNNPRSAPVNFRHSGTRNSAVRARSSGRS